MPGGQAPPPGHLLQPEGPPRAAGGGAEGGQPHPHHRHRPVLPPWPPPLPLPRALVGRQRAQAPPFHAPLGQRRLLPLPRPLRLLARPGRLVVHGVLRLRLYRRGDRRLLHRGVLLHHRHHHEGEQDDQGRLPGLWHLLRVSRWRHGRRGHLRARGIHRTLCHLGGHRGSLSNICGNFCTFLHKTKISQI